MANSQDGKRSSTASPFIDSAFSTFDALVDMPGRRGVRIFGLPREQLIMATVAALLFLVPVAILVGMMPFLHQLGQFSLFKQLNAYVAPAVDGLSFDHRPAETPRFPIKRFLI